MKLKFHILLTAFLCLFVFGCKKDKNATPTLPSSQKYIIKCENKIAGTYTVFRSNNDKYQEEWDFGDGNTQKCWGSAGATHTYKSSGIFTVTLIVNGDVANKVTETYTIEPNFSFYYGRTPTVGDTLFFAFYAYLPRGCTYYWTFGDGSSSSDSTPYHIYTADGGFNVKLKIKGTNTDTIITKDITIYKDPLFLHQLTRQRAWKGMKHIYQTHDSLKNNNWSTLQDTSFAITFIDQNTISCNSMKLTFDPASSYGDHILFSYSNAGSPQESIIYYDHVKDSLSIYTTTMYSPGPNVQPITEDTWWQSK